VIAGVGLFSFGIGCSCKGTLSAFQTTPLGIIDVRFDTNAALLDYHATALSQAEIAATLVDLIYRAGILERSELGSAIVYLSHPDSGKLFLSLGHFTRCTLQRQGYGY
jgi:hypothetical protein